MFERMDLDGLRIAQPSRGEVWLMYHGRRHYVANPDVYQDLFRDDNLLILDDIESIAVGPVLNSGSCLIQAIDELAIFLVTGEGAAIHKFSIPTYESFLDFGFNEDRVKKVPSIVLNGLPSGRAITSASDRATRLSKFQNEAT